ncbi:glutamate racemase [Pantoea sp. App145]|uniref:glutamate racemase n=1 Tax=Pantoea sp. App145 TaxID=3071567 RepID=UPI003A808760
MTIACLHTAASNIAIFDQAAASLGMPSTALNHLVMPHLLAEAELSGGMTPEQQTRLTALLHSLTPWFDAILITCSTLGPVADSFHNDANGCVVWRTDGMLADEVHRREGQSVVLCAAESTLAATTALFCPPARDGQQPEVRLIPDAWATFKAGDQLGYRRLIKEAVELARQQGAVNVALAQVSMAIAAQDFSEDQRPLTSPQLALRCAINRTGLSQPGQ